MRCGCMVCAYTTMEWLNKVYVGSTLSGLYAGGVLFHGLYPWLFMFKSFRFFYNNFTEVKKVAHRLADLISAVLFVISDFKFKGTHERYAVREPEFIP